jgi:hypothetical protein
MVELVVETAERPFGGTGVVVLNESIRYTQIRKLGLLIRFKKEAAHIAMNYRTQLNYTRKCCLYSLHELP